MALTRKSARRQAVATTLFPLTTLRDAVQRLGFVQADPIRSPARAQDLILRQRVRAYRAGDLEAGYSSLRLEEDYLYAYGFMPESTWKLLYPRREKRLTGNEQKILELVAHYGRMHPRDLEAHLGRKREINAWGGYSKATTRTLEALHYRGLLRIAGRENGIRIYEAAPKRADESDPNTVSPDERLRQLVLRIAAILAPVPERSLKATLRHLQRAAPHLDGRQSAVKNLLRSGDLVSDTFEQVRYVWPEGTLSKRPPQEKVRFLAPFDPLVWDRYRFEHLWEWAYRFEAYTPPAKRKMGYYAMPMLWRDDIVGWVNAKWAAGELQVERGFAGQSTPDAAFEREFEAEVERLRMFLDGRKRRNNAPRK